MFEGSSDLGRVGRGENSWLEIESVAVLCYGAGPVAIRAGSGCRGGSLAGRICPIGRFAGHGFRQTEAKRLIALMLRRPLFFARQETSSRRCGLHQRISVPL